MNRRSIAVFAALSIVVAALAAASVAYRILEAEAAGKKAAAVDFEALTAELSGVRNATDLGDGTLRVALTSHYKNAANILLIAVYERGSGMRWRIPADSDYLPAAENQKPFPQPTYPDRSAYLLSAPLRSDITGRLAVDALYSILDQNSIFLAFRDALLAIGAYLAASALFFAIAAAIGRKAGEGEKAPLAADPSIPPEPGKPATASPLADAYVPPEEDFEVPELKPFGPQTAEPEEQEKEVEDVFAEDLPEPDSEPASGSLAEPGLIPDQAKAGQIPSGSLKAPLAPTSGLYSPASGLGWESYLPERLDAELARSASFEQDLSLLEIAYDGGKRSSAAYTAVAKAITDFFTFRADSPSNAERMASRSFSRTSISIQPFA